MIREVTEMEDRDKLLESNLAGVLLQLDQQRLSLLSLIEKMKTQAIQQHAGSQ